MFARRRRGGGRRDEASDPYWVSFTDLLTALLFVFILAMLAFMAQVGQKQQELAQLENDLTARIDTLQDQRSAIGDEVAKLSTAESVRAQVLTETSQRLADLGITVEIDDGQSLLSIPSEELGFASGSYAISADHRSRALAIGGALQEILSEGDRAQHLDTVFIEGHTDARPFAGLNGMGNWGLSTFRAISLWQLWVEELPDDRRLDTMKNAAGDDLVSVSGYAHTRPLEGSATGLLDAPENRRIDIRITIVRPSSDDLEAILDVASTESTE